MFAKSVLLCFVQGLVVQIISGQCIGAPYEATWAAPWGAPYAAPLAPFAAGECGAGFIPAASHGGGFAVTSVSPIAPTGVFVTSENAYDGPVAVSGKLPFLSAIALEGSLPTVGGGAISYGCGNGNVAILNEELAPAAYAGPAGYGGPLGYGGPVGPLPYGAPVGEPFGYGIGGLGHPGCGYY